jgi:hypothetical protein
MLIAQHLLAPAHFRGYEPHFFCSLQSHHMLCL